MTVRNLSSKSHDVALVYAEVLNFVPLHCQSLLRAVSHVQHDHTHSNQQGYDFLVNAVFPEIVRTIEEQLSVIFAPGNPDMFYKVNYVEYELLCISTTLQNRIIKRLVISLVSLKNFAQHEEVSYI